MGEIHEPFVLALSLLWFAGATPEKCGKREHSDTKTRKFQKNVPNAVDWPYCEWL